MSEVSRVRPKCRCHHAAVVVALFVLPMPAAGMSEASVFARLGETTAASFLDTTSGDDAFECEVTGMMNQIVRSLARQAVHDCSTSERES